MESFFLTSLQRSRNESNRNGLNERKKKKKTVTRKTWCGIIAKRKKKIKKTDANLSGKEERLCRGLHTCEKKSEKMIGKNTLQKSYRINDHKGGSREGRKNCLFKIIVGVLIVPASRIFVNKSRSPR
jgi:hypothetical protein